MEEARVFEKAGLLGSTRAAIFLERAIKCERTLQRRVLAEKNYGVCNGDFGIILRSLSLMGATGLGVTAMRQVQQALELLAGIRKLARESQQSSSTNGVT